MVDITSLLRKLLNDELKKEKNFFGFKKVKLPYIFKAHELQKIS